MKPACYLPLLLACNGLPSYCTNQAVEGVGTRDNPPTIISDITLPVGFTRTPLAPGSFGAWLRTIPLKRDNTVYLYNGTKKENQSAQFAVLDISVGTRDLQQCADAVMRLRAEYLMHTGRENDIAFHASDGTRIDYPSWKSGYRFIEQKGRLKKVKTARPCRNDSCFHEYLDLVFTYCSTRSLSRELHSIPIDEVSAGDVLIHAGSPGHAVIVVDVIEDIRGTKRFMLAQSYMPAQNIHVLRNPLFLSGTVPWFNIPASRELYTPQWLFTVDELKRF